MCCANQRFVNFKNLFNKANEYVLFFFPFRNTYEINNIQAKINLEKAQIETLKLEVQNLEKHI